MELSKITGTASVILLDKLLNADSEGAINKAIEDAARQKVKKAVLDFRTVEHMTSLGASNLVKLTSIAGKEKIKLFAYGLSNRYRELFNMTGLITLSILLIAIIALIC